MESRADRSYRAPHDFGDFLVTVLLDVREHDALAVTNRHYPFLAYGTDWLAFAHLAIAVGFVGLWIDPVRNKWLITWGLILCAAVVPLALVAGAIRGIPLYWRLLDSSFGVIGSIPLLVCRHYVALCGENCHSSG